MLFPRLSAMSMLIPVTVFAQSIIVPAQPIVIVPQPQQSVFVPIASNYLVPTQLPAAVPTPPSVRKEERPASIDSNYVLVERYFVSTDAKGNYQLPPELDRLPTFEDRVPSRIIREINLTSALKPVPNLEANNEADRPTQSPPSNDGKLSSGRLSRRLDIPLARGEEPRKLATPIQKEETKTPPKSDESNKSGETKSPTNGDEPKRLPTESPADSKVQERTYPPMTNSRSARALRLVGILVRKEYRDKGPVLYFDPVENAGGKQSLKVDASNQFTVDLEPGEWQISTEATDGSRKKLQTVRVELGENQVIRIE